LFTDVEGSTRRWQEDEEGMRAALARHDKIVRSAIEDAGGVVFSTMGDGMAAAFANASGALNAALDAQDALAEVLPVRMGLHTGEAELRDGDYFGTAVNRCARLMAVAHGGQVVCSEVTAELVRDAQPTALVDLGEHRLRDLDRPLRVFQVGEGRFPALRSLDAFPGNLPLQLSSFVGRERDLARVGAALADGRVVTLTGVGGVGKTRLALQAAAEVLPRFSDGAWLVELAPVRDPAAVPAAMGAVFDVVRRGGQTLVEALVEFLRSKQLLVVMDNCEHVLEPAAELVETLERACPQMTVLATSREGLGIDGERMLAVPSLASPRADASHEAVAEAAAVRLFIERARAVKAEFAVTKDNAAAVAQVCRRLDGVPLAIELAAARVQAMTPAELARRLERRFEVLAGGRRGAVERHQTLRATIDWSYELLTEPQQRLLARLSVFAGGCTLEEVEDVCAGAPVEAGVVWELIATLVARSLVVAEDHGDVTRYRLLETIRQYGEERLDAHGETAELRDRHARCYAALFATLFPSWLIGYALEGLRRLAAEQDNAARAMQWALDTGDVDLALAILCHVPFVSAQAEMAFALPAEPVLALPGAHDHADYSMGLAIAADNAGYRGDLDIGERLCEQALAAEARLGTHPNGEVELSVDRTRSVLAMATGSWDEAAHHLERSADIARRAGHISLAANDLAGAASYRAYSGDHDAAVLLAVEALALARPTDNHLLLAHCLTALANALSASDPARARQCLRESFEISAMAGHEATFHVTEAIFVAAGLRDRDLALQLAARAVPRLHWNGDRTILAGVLVIVAWAATPTEPEAAAVLHSAARRLARAAIDPASGAPATVAGPAGGAGLMTDLRREATRELTATLGEDRLRELRAEGDRLGTDAAVATALDLIQRMPPP